MPSKASVDTKGLDRLSKKFQKLIDPDATPLMVTWSRIIDEDNKRGVLAGLDKNGNPMRPVTYRPIGHAQKKLSPNQRNLVAAKKRRGKYAGIGNHPAGENNNLTSAEYRRLTGPPLAPRGAFSRVITNFLTRFGRLANGTWEAVGYWNEVVSKDGVAFLKYHFNGANLKRGGRLPQRDLRGLRPEAQDKARKAARAWMLDIIRSTKD
jgi:hypothetical protein